MKCNRFGEVNDEYASSNRLMPLEQQTFTDLNLSATMCIYSFNDNDELYMINYIFTYTDKEKVQEDMERIVQYFKGTLPTSYEYIHDESTRSLLDYHTQEMFICLRDDWKDENETLLSVRIEPGGSEVFSMNVILKTKPK